MSLDIPDPLEAARALDIEVCDFGDTRTARGRSVYLQGQLHSNESAAFLVLRTLIKDLTRNHPANYVRIVPNANPVGWHRYIFSGEGRISDDGFNWNRIFRDPMRQDGTIDDMLAKTLWMLSSDFDVVIDVHTPDYGWPHVYAASQNYRLITMDDIPYVFYGEPQVGPFEDSHVRLRKNDSKPVWACATIEIPSHELPTEQFVDHWAERLRKEITYNAEDCNRFDASPSSFGKMLDLIPKISGAAVLQCQPGVVVKAGEIIMTIYDRKGISERMYAPVDCIPVCFRRATLVQAGYWCCRVISDEKS